MVRPTMNEPRLHPLATALLALALAACHEAGPAGPDDVDRLLRSPGGEVEVELFHEPGSVPELSLEVRLRGSAVLGRSPLGLRTATAEGDFETGLSLPSSSEREVDEAFTLASGKSRQVRHRARERTFAVRNAAGRGLDLVVRASDDGVAFRYVLPGASRLTLAGEASAFQLLPGSRVWAGDHAPHHEVAYTRREATDLGRSDLGLPVLVEAGAAGWALLTEAAVAPAGFPGSRFRPQAGPGAQRLAFAWAQPTVEGALPWATPWRVAILGATPGPIVESSLVEALSPPSAVADTSWVEPGAAVFPWWSSGGLRARPDTQLAFVDLAAEMGWRWLELETGLLGGGTRATDEWRTTPWVAEVAAYAAERGVRIYGWDEWTRLDTEEERRSAFEALRAAGLRGIKVDYLDGDDQARMRFREELLRDAAAYRLAVSFHGETVPRGERRRWPHLLAQEAVRGAEYYLFDAPTPPTPAHNVSLVFTRNAVGPMDYTPVTYSAPRETTDAHETALAVAFESGWTVLADSPRSYRSNPATEMLRDLPTAWDETRFLAGHPDSHACLARRRGEEWFLAALNAGPPRGVEVSLAFLPPGSHAGRCLTDGPAGPVVSPCSFEGGRTARLELLANGGFLARLPGSAVGRLAAPLRGPLALSPRAWR